MMKEPSKKQPAEELFLALGPVFPFRQLVREDQTSAAPGHLDHLDREFLADALLHLDAPLILVQVAGQVDQVGGGDKAAQMAKVHQHAPLVIANHLAHGDLAGLQELLGQQPILALEGL